MITTETMQTKTPILLYLSTLAPSGRRSQHISLSGVVQHLCDGAFGLGDFPWHQMEPEQLSEMRQWLLEKYAPMTVNRVLAGVRQILKLSWMQGLIDQRQYELSRLILKTVPETSLMRGRMLQANEIRLLMSAAGRQRNMEKALRDRALLAVLFGAGLRASELLALDLKDYKNKTLVVLKSKGFKSREVPILRASDRLDEWIWARGDWQGPLFTRLPVMSMYGQQRLGYKGMLKVLMTVTRMAGVGTWMCHDARRTYISTLLATGSDLATAGALAGHSKPQSTVTYDKRSHEARIAAVGRLELPI